MTLRKRTLALLVAAALTPLAASVAQAQYAQHAPPAPPAAQAPQRIFTQAELDQMLAPIALYPDPLLSQVLMAATYPIEVVEAARWTRANPGLHGDAAVRAVQNQDWDPSVQSLVAFPQILQRMDEQLGWTESLGDAFLAQEPMLMDTVQQLRHRAQAAGHLRSTPQIRVIDRGPVIVVEPAEDVVYVPYYDPLVVYGNWWWPTYRPVHWAPWPGYALGQGSSIGLWFGRPSGISLSFFFGDFDWGRHSVRVVRPTAFYYRQPRVFVSSDRSSWQHDPSHRRGVHYRAPEVRQRFAAAPTRQAAPARQGAPTRQAAQARVVRQEPQREQRQERRDDRREARQEQRPQRDHQQAARVQQQQQRQENRQANRERRQENHEQRNAQHGERERGERKGGNG